MNNAPAVFRRCIVSTIGSNAIQKSLKTLSFLAFLMPKKSQIPLFLPLLGFSHPFSPHSETRKTQRRGRLRLILDNSIGTAEALPVAMSDLGVGMNSSRGRRAAGGHVGPRRRSWTAPEGRGAAG